MPENVESQKASSSSPSSAQTRPGVTSAVPEFSQHGAGHVKSGFEKTKAVAEETDEDSRARVHDSQQRCRGVQCSSH